ncbi:hypothetical protein DFP72DRAFT_1075184 [Ephemerocybe angulata]|uniref:Uncharacterized protein n=1 Tax=Ephemerocybe angulata TaxID=980116 RepID=A0A8H6M0R8_9AGAR|nr:hypothetical protein DFP72DRAFT_1075184 [Tulosesus angulatus]
MALAAFLATLPSVKAAGVLATGPQGPTNPPEPTLGTSINQTSFARLLSVNSVDDFCLFAPPAPQNIGDSETYEVAWCTKPRNDARVIPDGTITGVSFLKTDFYVQILGYGNLTRLNVPNGDYGGELDPHGQFGAGNPIGGNVTSNVTGSDQHFAEWMQYISYSQFCLRICTNANSTYSAADMCWHELDEMGCEFVMPGNYKVNGTFESCDADVAYPPGWYPTATISGTPVFSTFAQRYTGTESNGHAYTVGDTATPSAPYSTPSSSDCRTTSTISNGIPLTALGLAAASTSRTASKSSSGAKSSSSAPASTAGATKQAKSGERKTKDYSSVDLLKMISGVGAFLLFN